MPLSRPIVTRTIAAHLAAWAVLSLLVGTVLFGEYQRRGLPLAFSNQLRITWLLTAWLQVLSVSLSLVWQRHPHWLESARRLWLGYAIAMLVMLPAELVYQAALGQFVRGLPLTAAAIADRLATEPRSLWLECALYQTGVYVWVGAFALRRHGQARQQAWQRAETENLNLRLSLEQQRMAALRAQLEPHFMFNALNAVSALVRQDDKKPALAAISRLSDLLRYALAAGQRDWSTVHEELAFLESYLALQRIRYGARLQLRVEGDDARVRACECPPLLLQPLVENALRHDLDCHDEASDVMIRFACSDNALSIRICNPYRAGAEPNPGLGLGLANTRERLQHAYGGEAVFESTIRDGRFCVELTLPAGAFA